MNVWHGTFAFILACLFWLPPLAAEPFDSAKFNNQAGPLEIMRITPAGKDVPPGRQIVFQFNRPVVPVGKMERDADEIPITIMPKLQCEWRWLNTSALACQLTEKNKLLPATRYRVLVQPEIKAEDGTALARAYNHEFITQRPDTSYTRFKTWTAPSMPHIRASFNQAVSRESVEKHLYFLKAGGERMPLKATVDPDEREDVFIRLKNGNLLEFSEVKGKTPPDIEQTPTYSRVWLLSPEKLLGEDQSVELRVEPGLESRHGPERGVGERVVLQFNTFPSFRFLGVSCTDNNGNELTFAATRKPSVQRRCNPLRQVALRFSAPVTAEVARDHLVVTPDLAGGRKDYDPWEKVHAYSRLGRPHRQGEEYTIWLPELLKAYETYRLQAKPGQFRDEFGRALPEPIDMRFLTDHRRPDYTFEHNVSVLEKNVDSEVPIYVTNLDKLSLTYQTLTGEGVKSNQHAEIKIPRVQDIAFKIPMNMREWLKAPSGVIQGGFGTAPSVERDWDNWFFSQVTPFHVQVKLGHYNSLVWVTDFATGLPVSGVKVTIFEGRYDELEARPKVLAEGLTTENGIAMLAGLEKIDPELNLLNNYGRKHPHLFARCEKEGDLALVPVDYPFGVDMYELSEDYIYSYSREKYGHIHTWGTTAQGVYRVGDTVQYKLFVRDQNNRKFVLPPLESYNLEVIDPTGKTVYEVKEFKLSEFGAHHGEFTLPKTASVGWYEFRLSSGFTEQTWHPLRVLVSDFTPSPFRVNTELDGKLFHQGEQVTVTTSANLHSGGPYADAHSQVYAILSQEFFESDHPKTKGFSFDTYLPDKYDQETVHESEGQVNNRGLRETRFTLPESWVLYGTLRVESTVRDERGKDVANTATARYVGRDRYVGLKKTAWVATQGQPASVLALVVDETGKPVADTSVAVQIERRETKASRVKGAGNAYLTQYEHEWVKTGECQLTPGTDPSDCQFTPDKPGYYKLTAKIQDTQGRAHETVVHQWVAGKGSVVWDMGSGNGMKITPEKTSYRVGETARFLVQNPYPGAQALVTVERYGVLKSWVQRFEDSVQILEVPVEPDYIPGFFLSAAVMSPRVEKPIDKDGVDLGKPAFRMGYVKMEVKDPYKELSVAVKPEKQEYRPRDKVGVQLQAGPRQKEVTAGPLEFAVAVLDEAVFDLIGQGREYFDPYKGFYTLEQLDMRNYNILLRLVGRQNFEKKGANPGGDGGVGPEMRSMFKFVSYWNPSLKADHEGRARIEFEVPDNLTGWRVLAMAVNDSDLMGLGDANFKVNQPIELRPVMPNQVTTGDRFQAGFSVMNRTEREREIKLQLSASGPLKLEEGEESKLEQTVKLAPYKRQTVWLPLNTDAPGRIEFVARAESDGEKDGLKHELTVRKRRSLETGATYGTTVSDAVTESLAYPEDIYPDAGGISLALGPTVIGNVEGAFEYMRDYPYTCWEQRLSKGVMASHYKQLRDWLPENLAWEEAESLPPDILALAAEYQAPNGGMTYYVPQDRYVSPYLSAYTALAFDWLRQAGHQVPEALEKKLHQYLINLLRRDVMPDFYSAGMASSVRAVALHALARRGKIGVEDIERYAPHLQQMSLFGRANFLSAALRVKNTESRRHEAAGMILAQAVESGGKITFNEELDDSYQRILASPLRDNCAVLGTLVTYSESPGAKGVGQLPVKLARSIVEARKSRTHWENTQENLFCMNALIEYARVFEKEKPDMQVRAFLEEEKLGETRFQDARDPAVTFERPMSKQDPGRQAKLKIEREGRGRLYYGLRMQYAPKLEKAEAVNAGIEVRREYHVERDGKWQLLSSPMKIKTGELLRVDLYLSLPTARNFVVVDDPIPGGLEPVNRDLATASTVAADKAESDYAGGSFWFKFSDWREYGASFWSFYHKELRHHAAIFYSDYLPPGNYHLAYTAQAIAPGEFVAMPAHSEEMYEPDVYGKSAPALLQVERAE